MQAWNLNASYQLLHPEYGGLVSATYSRRDFWQMKRLDKPRNVDDVSWKLAVVKLELDFMQLVMKVRKEKANSTFTLLTKKGQWQMKSSGRAKI